MAALDDLKASVESIKREDAAIIALCNTLGQKITAALANNDTATIQDIANQLSSEARDVASAVLANTPADPNAPTQVDTNPPVDPNASAQDQPVSGRTPITSSGEDTDAGMVTSGGRQTP